MLTRTPKRFYKQVSVVEGEGGFAVHLDQRPVKTPMGKTLLAPWQGLAQAMADEWQGQKTHIRPATMPLTQLASTALDRIGPDRAEILRQMVQYAASDLLCYRAEFPPDLQEHQNQHWQPLLHWAEATMGAALVVTQGIMAVPQPASAIAAVATFLDGYDVWRLTALQAAAPAAGSVILAAALVEGRIDAARLFQLSQLDESYQIEQWGADYEAIDRREALRADMEAVERWLKLLLEPLGRDVALPDNLL